MTDKPSTFELSAHSMILYNRLFAAKLGEVVPYKELSGLVGRDVTGHGKGSGRGALRTAVRRLLRDDGRVYGCVRGEGLKWLAEGEVARGSRGAVRAVCRKARREVLKIQTIRDFNSLPAGERVLANAALSVLGAVAAVSRAAGMRRVEERVGSMPNPLQLDVGTTLSLFRPTTTAAG